MLSREYNYQLNYYTTPNEYIISPPNEYITPIVNSNSNPPSPTFLNSNGLQPYTPQSSRSVDSTVSPPSIPLELRYTPQYPTFFQRPQSLQTPQSPQSADSPPLIPPELRYTPSRYLNNGTIYQASQNPLP